MARTATQATISSSGQSCPLATSSGQLVGRYSSQDMSSRVPETLLYSAVATRDSGASRVSAPARGRSHAPRPVIWTQPARPYSSRPSATPQRAANVTKPAEDSLPTPSDRGTTTAIPPAAGQIMERRKPGWMNPRRRTGRPSHQKVCGTVMAMGPTFSSMLSMAAARVSMTVALACSGARLANPGDSAEAVHTGVEPRPSECRRPRMMAPDMTSSTTAPKT